MENKLSNFFYSFFKITKKETIKDPLKLSEELANMIAFLNRKVFDNEAVTVYLIPPNIKEWEDAPGNALYCSSEDYFAVLVKNIHQLTITSYNGLFGTAAHEVRHRFQAKYPDSILSENFLIKSFLIKKSIPGKIKNLMPDANLKLELDAMIIEEIVRNKCKGLSLEEILTNKTGEIVNIITCNEKTILNFI